MLGSSGQVLFDDIIRDVWYSEVKKEVSRRSAPWPLLSTHRQSFQEIMHNIGATCIADPSHVHWFSFRFATPEMCDKFHDKVEEAFDLAEADRLRQNLRLDIVTDIVRKAEVAK